MAPTPPPPLELPWTPKSLDSATTRCVTLDRQRVRYEIEHDVLRGVTPAMLVWWFNNIEGDMELDGVTYPRYRVWHPRDHVCLRYGKRAPDGSRAGPGAVLHIQEFFDRRPEFAVDHSARVERLDDHVFSHVEYIHRVAAARMDIRFDAVEGGTRYRNALTVGIELPIVASVLNRWVRPRMFPDAKGQAWVRHNVEEVGNFETFLPALWERHRADEAG